MHKRITMALAGSLALAVATPASATIAIVFNGFDAGFTNFNNTVTGTGGTVSTRVLGSSGQATFSDFNITRNSSGNPVASLSAPYSLFNASPARTTTGGVIDISPSGPNTTPRGAPLQYKASGITFNFANPINALGFEVGDWATCCQPSNLYIQFGNNAPILVGASTTFGDQFLTNGGAGVFVAAFDDTDTFQTVSFWGDGVGEFLVAGGTIRYANIGRGTLPPGVPEPATWAMMILGFGLTGAAMRRRQRTQVSFV